MSTYVSSKGHLGTFSLSGVPECCFYVFRDLGKALAQPGPSAAGCGKLQSDLRPHSKRLQSWSLNPELCPGVCAGTLPPAYNPSEVMLPFPRPRLHGGSMRLLEGGDGSFPSRPVPPVWSARRMGAGQVTGHPEPGWCHLSCVCLNLEGNGSGPSGGW